jgi:hypothetical protein
MKKLPGVVFNGYFLYKNLKNRMNYEALEERIFAMNETEFKKFLNKSLNVLEFVVCL